MVQDFSYVAAFSCLMSRKTSRYASQTRSEGSSWMILKKFLLLLAEADLVNGQRDLSLTLTFRELAYNVAESNHRLGTGNRTQPTARERGSEFIAAS
jgi:hypothetical protein